jgi:pilus assembly protein Flp/PilA
VPNSQIVFLIIYIGRIPRENVFFGRFSRDHEIACFRVPFRIFGTCTKTDEPVTNVAEEPCRRCPPLPVNDVGTMLVNAPMSVSCRDCWRAKRTSWHSGCDVHPRQRDCAFARGRISHTRHGAWNRAGRIVMYLVNRLRSLVRNDEGQDLLEYALLVALIALVAVAAVTAAGQSVNQIFSSIAAALGKAA